MTLSEYNYIQECLSNLLRPDTLRAKGFNGANTRYEDSYKQAVLACKSVIRNFKPKEDNSDY